MPILDLSIDTLLTTTRSVRKRLDLSRPVERTGDSSCYVWVLLSIESSAGTRGKPL